MIDLKTIVAATDLSPLSLHAVKHAAELAKQFKASLTVMNAVAYPLAEFIEQCQKDYGHSIEECEQKHMDEAEEALRQVDTSPADPARVTRVAVKGMAVDQIVKFAEDSKADLLVIGTHGFTGLKHVFLGSIAESVVRLAPCPVLTVRDPDHQS